MEDFAVGIPVSQQEEEEETEEENDGSNNKIFHRHRQEAWFNTME